MKEILPPKDGLAGEYRATVTSTEHPDGLMLVQVRVFGLMDDVPEPALPWAEYLLPIGARENHGDFLPCLRGGLGMDPV